MSCSVDRYYYAQQVCNICMPVGRKHCSDGVTDRLNLFGEFYTICLAYHVYVYCELM
jgi:hypothetical protein